MNWNLGMYVETERLVLRRPTLADVPALFEFLGDDEIYTGRKGVRRLDEPRIDVDDDRPAVGNDQVHRQCSMPVERRDYTRQHGGEPR